MFRSHVMVCGGTGCTSSGSDKIAKAFEDEILATGLENEVKVIRTGCFGLCALGPIVVIYPEGSFYSMVKEEDVKEIVDEHLLKGRPVTRLLYDETVAEDNTVKSLDDTAFYKKQMRIALRNCGVINPENIDEYIAFDGYQALGKVLTEMTPDDVIQTILDSGLRGRGGAGFPTGRKWQLASGNRGNVQKYVCCNADEGDPGAFMDRSVLEGDPHVVIEAMAIAGYAIGASQGYVYIRAEYPIAVHRLQVAIDQAREYGLLGNNIFGTDFCFDLDIKLGAGAFVCGEETALMTSIEGKRGEPRPRPPFPAVKGLFGKPTILNNVETYANVPQIILKGADWFASMGTEKSKGTKVFALGGKIKNTGLVEIPMGTTLRTIVEEIGGGIPGGKKFKAAQTGGPSGGCIPASLIDTPIDYDNLLAIGSMMGSGGLIVMDEDTCIGYRQVFPGIHRRRKLRQVHAVPRGHQASAGAAEQDHGRQGHHGGSGQNHRAGRIHQIQQPVRPGPDSPEPRPLHTALLPRRICGAHRQQALPGGRVQGAAELQDRPRQVQGLHAVRAHLPGRRHQRHRAPAAYHRYRQVC